MSAGEAPPLRSAFEIEADFRAAAHLGRALDFALCHLEHTAPGELDMAAVCALSEIVTDAQVRLLDDFRALHAAGAFAACPKGPEP